VKACTSCHGGVQVLGAPRVAEHSRCQSCHDPHRAKASPEATCQGCHQRVEARHPRDARLGACAGCHTIHPARGQTLATAASCASCHKKAASETAFHAGGVACQACHRPHQFALKGAGAALCSSCHAPAGLAGGGRPGDGKPIAVTKGHADCTRCHREAAHAPKKPVPACASCHAPEHDSLTRGHDRCVACHRPHDGAVQRPCANAGCHARQLTGRHATPKVAARATCTTCHRAHGPGGVTSPRQCTSCHDQVLPGMHQHREHRDCKRCHGFHDLGPRQGRAACLEPCHSAQVGHEPAAVLCTGCHPFGGST